MSSVSDLVTDLSAGYSGTMLKKKAVGTLCLEFWREVPSGDLNWGDGSLVICIEARGPYVIVQTAPPTPPPPRPVRGCGGVDGEWRPDAGAPSWQRNMLVELRENGQREAESEHASFAGSQRG